MAQFILLGYLFFGIWNNFIWFHNWHMELLVSENPRTPHGHEGVIESFENNTID